MIVDSRGNPIAPAARADNAGSVGGIQRRSDTWINEMTGVGSYADKTVYGRFATVRRITDVEITNLRNGSPLAAKIIEKRPTEMFRRGYTLHCDDVDASAVKDLQDYAEEELHFSDEFRDASILGNQYGGDAVVLGIDDGGMPDEPLDETAIKTFTFLNGIDRRFSYVMAYYVDAGPQYSRPSHYLTSNAVAGYQYGSGANQQTKPRSPSALQRGGFFTQVIHESRILRFEGVETDVVTRQTLAGWTWSILQRLYDSMRKYEHAFDCARYLLSDASQAVMTLKGYIDAISNGKEDAIMTRMAIADRTRSVLRTLVIDEGEKFERAATPFGGISDVLEQMKSVLCADSGYPYTELFGKAPSGLNAAAGSDSETRKWYDQIASEQTSKLAPQYTRGYRLLSLSADCPVKLPKTGKTGKPLKFEIKFKPLFTPTDEEEAKTQLARAQRDQIYLSETVITPEELALDIQDMYPSMDVEGRELAIKGGETFDPAPNDPEPAPPVIVAPGAPGASPVPGKPGAKPPAAAAPPAKPVPPGKLKPGAKQE